MLADTTSRVESSTAEHVNAALRVQEQVHVSHAVAGGPERIRQRLEELDREWNIERVIEVEAPMAILLGIALGVLHNRRWLGLSAFAASMVMLHSLQGRYPLLPLLRRLGVRSQNEIERERAALRAARGDDRAFVPAVHRAQGLVGNEEKQ